MSKKPNSTKVTYLNGLARRLHIALGEKCYICGNHLSQSEITKDHVFPKSMGFSIEANMMPAHFDCNNNKADRLPTFKEIELSQNSYDAIKVLFDPRIMLSSRDIITKPINYFINQLKEAA